MRCGVVHKAAKYLNFLDTSVQKLWLVDFFYGTLDSYIINAAQY